MPHSLVVWTIAIVASLSMVTPRVASSADAPFVGEAFSGMACTSFDGTRQGYGPFDYRKYSRTDEKLWLVESAHFTPEVSSLRKGNTNSTPEPDLNYTLRAFPNHHHALFSIIRYYTGAAQQIHGLNPLQQTRFPPPECYLRRAMAFAPQDATLHFLFGIYLHRLGELEEAASRYRKGLSMRPESAEARYNYGILLFDMGKYQQAQEQARRAYQLGYPLQGLRNKLADKGYAP